MTIANELRFLHDRVLVDRCQVQGQRNYDRDGTPQHTISGTTGHGAITLLLKATLSCTVYTALQKPLKQLWFTVTWQGQIMTWKAVG